MLPATREHLHASGALVLQAPPGAGKTTLVPLALLDAAWRRGQRIVMLEPRRLAARAAAHRMAALRGERVGDTIGYRMRGDTRVGPATQIEVVTEGILTRRLERDPTLDGVALVIFDEFHERSLDADLALALTLRTRALLRDDLRILIMSATLDTAPVAALLGGAPTVTAEGRLHPVETRYRPPRDGERADAAVGRVVNEALASDEGDLLVFLPGAAEIRCVEALLAERTGAGVDVVPLYGMLTQAEQDRALQPARPGARKVVLATSIAETSLTIEGVRAVIDAGFTRAPRFSPRSGMTRLETVRVSRASADQRRGRAGRVAPGVCYRLWPEHETVGLLAQSPPEITTVDLAPLALALASAGVDDANELAWLDAPAPAAFAQARELLRELDALTDAGALTPEGRAMAALPVHPRLARMLRRARDEGTTRLACELAALLSERDLFRAPGAPIDPDVGLRLDAVHGGGVVPAGAALDRATLGRVRAEADRLSAQLQAPRGRVDASAAAGLLALAYPDRVARRRPGTPRVVLRNGRGALMSESSSLAGAEYVVAAELDDARPDSRIRLAAAVTEDELRARFADQIVSEEVVEVDDAAAAVRAWHRERLGAIVLREWPARHPDPERLRAALLDLVRRRGVASLPWSDAARRLRERIAFVAHHRGDWPDLSDAALAARLDEWLGPLLHDESSAAELARVDLAQAMQAELTWEQRRALDALAPTHLVVPTGSRLPVDYADPDAPQLAVRLQELFGLAESPRVLDGAVPITLQLLSPAHRPVQVTRDLAGFWRTSYFDVRRELRGRYPKHEWPADPLSAAPTRRAKPRGT